MTTTEQRAAGLSPGAQFIFQQVLEAFQSAEELGGVEDADDYLVLCDAIVQEIQDRRAVAVVGLEASFVEGDEYATERRLDERARVADINAALKGGA